MLVCIEKMMHKELQNVNFILLFFLQAGTAKVQNTQIKQKLNFRG